MKRLSGGFIEIAVYTRRYFCVGVQIDTRVCIVSQKAGLSLDARVVPVTSNAQLKIQFQFMTSTGYVNVVKMYPSDEIQLCRCTELAKQVTGKMMTRSRG